MNFGCYWVVAFALFCSLRAALIQAGIGVLHHSEQATCWEIYRRQQTFLLRDSFDWENPPFRVLPAAYNFLSKDLVIIMIETFPMCCFVIRQYAEPSALRDDHYFWSISGTWSISVIEFEGQTIQHVVDSSSTKWLGAICTSQVILAKIQIELQAARLLYGEGQSLFHNHFRQHVSCSPWVHTRK